MVERPGALGRYPQTRMRRNRREDWSRRLTAETVLTAGDLIWTVFVCEGEGRREPVGSMPGIDRLSTDVLAQEARAAYDLGIPALAVFPQTPQAAKKPRRRRGPQPRQPGSARRYARSRRRCPRWAWSATWRLDPYTSHGHDGLIRDGYVVNDETVDVLCRQALVQAEAGCDVIAPST